MSLGNPYQIKCLFAGESGVGKTTLIHLIHKGFFNETSEPTIGVAFSVETIELQNSSGQIQTIKAHNWDAAGSMRFRSIVRQYMRNLDLVFLVFDMNNRESWERLSDWKKEIEDCQENSVLPNFVLVGNKSDRHKYQVTDSEIQDRCHEWGCKRYILSCVELSGRDMATRMYRKSVLELHHYLLTLDPLPNHLVQSSYKKLQLSLDSDAPKCCHIQ